MKQEIKIKNGVIKKLDIDKNKEIYIIGYTLNKNNTGYDKAIIVRDENESLITDNQEVIMRFFNLFAEQRSIPLENVFHNSDILLLNGANAAKLNKLIEMRDYLDALKDEKKVAILKSSIASFLCVISYIATNMPIDKYSRFITSAMIILSVLSAGKNYKNVKTLPVFEVENELYSSIEKLSSKLYSENEKK